MVFSSAFFLFVFFPAVFLLYYLLPGLKTRNAFLAFASVVFISFGQLVYVPVFLFSILVNYLSGLLLMGDHTRRKVFLWLAVLMNIGVLVFFKYTDFLVENLNGLFGMSVGTLDLVLPIGISFYTFQGLSYTIDVYRDKSNGTRSFGKLLLYISLFPQLIAGPIVKYHDISRQIDEREPMPEEISAGIRRFVFGLAKKLLIANSAGSIADAIFNGGLYADWRLAWLGAVCYTLQIYYDFSGYSDMAIGIGHMFGFTIRENFLHPYGANSMIEFWRRWHVSLSAWFREYVYIPLGGNRHGRARTIRNRFVVFFCTGLWHGANWTFVLWGLGHGLLTSLEQIGLIPTKRLQKTAAGRLLCRMYVLLSVMLLFVLFRAESLSLAADYLGAMFSFAVLPEGVYQLGRLLTPAACCTLLLGTAFAGNLPEKLQKHFAETVKKRQLLCAVGELLLLLLCMMNLSRGGFNPFIYFQF